ncbi:MAG: hypothetical protein N2170_06945, partial [Bacteroidia bacterium]|nr:hypothetical protein [Bacteroidia bacterium]
DWLVRSADPRGVVLGYDHRFGRGREGSAQLLREKGLSVREVPPVVWGGKPVSSSRIREALLRGNVAEAHHLLGYPYSIGGNVREGRKEARLLGTPTANISWPEGKVRPPAGIYTGWAHITPRFPGPVREGLPALLYLPPQGELEVHLLTENRNLYGLSLRVGFLEYLRPHATFESQASLEKQIQEDVAAARRYFGL